MKHAGLKTLLVAVAMVSLVTGPATADWPWNDGPSQGGGGTAESIIVPDDSTYTTGEVPMDLATLSADGSFEYVAIIPADYRQHCPCLGVEIDRLIGPAVSRHLGQR